MGDCRGFGHVGKLRELGGSINLDIYTPRTLSTIPLIDQMGAEEDTEGTESDEEVQDLEKDVIEVARKRLSKKKL